MTVPICSIVVLSHADTDVIAVNRVKALLPPEISVTALSLGAINDGRCWSEVLDGELAQANVIVVRVLEDVATLEILATLKDRCPRRGQSLVLVSAAGEFTPQHVQAGNVPADVTQSATEYLLLGGSTNLVECFKYLSDRLMLTGLGYEPPAEVPLHGIYLPGAGSVDIQQWTLRSDPQRATAALLFYRAHHLSGNTEFVDALVTALHRHGLNALALFTSGRHDFEGEAPPLLRLIGSRADVVISTLSFALGRTGLQNAVTPSRNCYEQLGLPVIQAIASGDRHSTWQASPRGLSTLDTAINVAVPEFDGRIVTVPISFKERDRDKARYVPHHEGCGRVASIAARQARLRHVKAPDKRVAFVLTNSLAKASHVGNAVGLDAPASLLRLMHALKARGYRIGSVPRDADELMHQLLSGGTYDELHPLNRECALSFRRDIYLGRFESWPDSLRSTMQRVWGEPATANDPWSDAKSFYFAGVNFGNVLVALQPPRAHGMDPHETYHQPDLPPTHHYAAFYHALTLAADRGGFGVDAIVHMGKHGTLEWLPGKSVGLSSECFADALLADMPLIYPFLVSDPGEGTQAKRRGHAVIVDHLAPPMTNAETYGPLQTLKELLDDYYRTENLDPLKLPMLRRQIWEQVRSAGLQTDLTLRGELPHGHSHDHDSHESHDLVISPETIEAGETRWVEKLEEYLCELGLLQIRDGLHVLGQMPPMPETLRALTRLQNAAAPSLQRALAHLMGFELEQLLAHPGRRLPTGTSVCGVDCATGADVLEALETRAFELFSELERAGFQEGEIERCQMAVLGRASREVRDILMFACRTLVPAIEQVTDEIDNVLAALEGKYVPAGPAGAPTRGMAHVLPTGRNFHTMDPRAVPSIAAWEVGQRLAHEVLERYRTEKNVMSETVGIAVWGTAQMRTQGDDIAQVLALLGVEPVWEPQTRRLSGIRLIPLSKLGRPRIDVLVTISGLFRDAFSHVIDILDEAVQLVIRQDEPLTQNFPRKHFLEDLSKPMGVADDVERRIRRRIFGPQPGAYGTGIQEVIAGQKWRAAPDFAQAFVNRGGYAYGGGSEPVEAKHAFAQQLRRVSIAVQNQDNREHDIFDSSEYYQFHGGLIAAAQMLSGNTPSMYVGDNSRPERPCVRDLREEALRVYRSRVVNPKWIEGVKRHGYKGGLELAATVDNIFAFDAVAGIAPDLMYEGLAENYAFAADVRRFLQDHNPWALRDIANRLLEAASRGMWGSADHQALERLRGIGLDAETAIEARAENLQELA